MPAANEADLEDLPVNVRESMNFIPVDTVDEVLDTALLDLPALPAEPPTAAVPDPPQVRPEGEEPVDSPQPVEYVTRAVRSLTPSELQ